MPLRALPTPKATEMDSAYWDLMRRARPNEYDPRLHEFAELEYPGESVEWVIAPNRPEEAPLRRTASPRANWWDRLRGWVAAI